MKRLLNVFGWGREEATTRLQVRCTPAMKERVIALKVNTGAQSVAELVRWGFIMISWAWNLTRDGGRLIAEHADGERVEILLPWQQDEEGK